MAAGTQRSQRLNGLFYLIFLRCVHCRTNCFRLMCCLATQPPPHHPIRNASHHHSSQTRAIFLGSFIHIKFMYACARSAAAKAMWRAAHWFVPLLRRLKSPIVIPGCSAHGKPSLSCLHSTTMFSAHCMNKNKFIREG